MVVISILFTIAVAALIAAIRIYEAVKRKKAEEAERLRLSELLPSLPYKVCEALKELLDYFSYSHYITESERLHLVAKHEQLAEDVSGVLEYFGDEDLAGIEEMRRFDKAMSDTIGFKKTNNEKFVLNQLSVNKYFFDTILSHPLDRQQREAILSLEDNVLVISSAGSGKTMTTVGKVRYLVDIQGIDPSRILLITFTRKAAESLSERLGEKTLKCVTFHKLALDIIAQVTGEKPSLVASDFSVQIYEKLMNDDKKFRSAVADYILRSRYKMKDQFDYSDASEYIRDRKKYGVKTYYKDMYGNPVFCKSDEEAQIADFLGGRGVKFRYEEKYEFSTYDSEYRQYTPDFSIYFTDNQGVQRRVYLEHFAVNEHGHCPKWFTEEEETRYLADISWKRELHRTKGTSLIETSSADFHMGRVFDKLEKELTDLGIVFSNESNDVAHMLEKQEKNIIDLLTSFNLLMKAKSMTLNDVISQGLYAYDSVTVKSIIAPFISAYKLYEEERHEIDFTDAIIRATELCNSGHRPDYDYILVDEFQDISIDRYKFLQSLRNNYPLTKLFCVGDDWQSIYRFAGSDMALFKSFSKYFGYTKECRMETTYRFGEPLIAKSSKFILANPDQKEKNVRSFNPKALTNIDFVPTNGHSEIPSTVATIIDSIPEDQSIYILGRYSFDVNCLKGSLFKIQDKGSKFNVTYKGRTIDFMTVHQSKGLESDFVILLNCNAGTLGFPADISDSPVLKYVLSEPDGYAFGEERRVFYVGITRAKRYTFVLYDINHPSTFVTEFVDGLNEKAKEEQIPEDELCPRCRCGRVETIRKGIAVNGNPYYVVRCSNMKYGCDYYETKFVNLNSRRYR